MTSFSGFTLAELLVVMSIIGILALWISNINFSRLSQKQQISIESIKIINLVEEARNNALIWKWVGISLITPESWSVILENTNSSGSLEISYLNGTSIAYSDWNTPKPFSISDLECRELNDDLNTASWSFILTFTGSLGWISNCTGKKLNFNYGVWPLTQNITINTLSWVIEVD